MPRPTRVTGERVTSPIRFPKELHEELRRVADERDTSINHLVLKAAAHYLDCLPPLDIPGHQPQENVAV